MEHNHRVRQYQGESVPTLRVLVKRKALQDWFFILRQGFLVETRLGCTVKTMLLDRMGLSPAYLEKRVQSVFLDGKVIDDLDSSVVKEGCTLALSAALPGFVGAAFRRGGYYAAMRSGTTSKREAHQQEDLTGVLTLKLFNLVADELGEAFFERGILVHGRQLDAFLKNKPADFLEGLEKVELNGQPVESAGLKTAGRFSQWPLVRLEVAAER
jgi:hypothetical protein